MTPDHVNPLPIIIRAEANALLTAKNSKKRSVLLSLRNPGPTPENTIIFRQSFEYFIANGFNADAMLSSSFNGKELKIWDKRQPEDKASLKIIKTRGGSGPASIIFIPEEHRLILWDSRGVVLWNSKNWREPSLDLDFEIEELSIQGALLTITQLYAKHIIDLSDFPRLRWLKAEPAVLALKNCDATDSTGLPPIIYQLLAREGAIVPPVKSTYSGLLSFSWFSSRNSSLSPGMLDRYDEDQLYKQRERQQNNRMHKEASYLAHSDYFQIPGAPKTESTCSIM